DGEVAGAGDFCFEIKALRKAGPAGARRPRLLERGRPVLADVPRPQRRISAVGFVLRVRLEEGGVGAARLQRDARRNEIKKKFFFLGRSAAFGRSACAGGWPPPATPPARRSAMERNCGSSLALNAPPAKAGG